MTLSPIYLDYAATTPLDERVLEAMLPFLTREFGNAASRQHAMGQRAARAVAQAREQVAQLIGADPREIVFTSGATESNNLALKGVATARAYEHSPKHFVTARTEHHALLDPLAKLEQQSQFNVTRLAVDGAGHVDLDELDEVLQARPRLVSLMHVNNEIGTMHPLQDIGERCRAAGSLFHTDASQSVGKVPIDVNPMGIDLLSLSAHKFAGPKGVGALYLRRSSPRVRCDALFDGGGQEGDRRSGTLNVPGIVGLGAAAELAQQLMETEGVRVATQAQNFLSDLQARIGGIQRNGSEQASLPSILNLSFEGVNAESLLSRFVQVCASSSSACTSARLQESHVLRALGLEEDRIAGSLRFSLGRQTTDAELASAVDEIERAVRQERLDGAQDICRTETP